jgi:rhodanese-related sulfurtransferase
MMDKDSSITNLYVRTEEDFNTGYIAGALLISNPDILDETVETLTGKSTTILVYCRSDRKSAFASSDLVGLGSSNVYDLGGLND